MKQWFRLLALLVLSASASAEIIVEPPQPLTTDSIRIRLVNQYTSSAIVTAESLVRSDNRIDIRQSVSLLCVLLDAPVLQSSFDLDPLPPGSYTVVATIELTFVPGFGCPADAQLQQQSQLV